jgi:hypothetical protein
MDWSQLKLGDEIEAKVLDASVVGELVLALGDEAQASCLIIRVINDSQAPVQAGDRLCLRVTAIRPPRFRLVPSGDEKRRLKRLGRLDASV